MTIEFFLVSDCKVVEETRFSSILGDGVRVDF